MLKHRIRQLRQKIRSRYPYEWGPNQFGVWSAAGLTAIMGIVNLLSAIYPSLPDRRHWIEAFLPFALRSGSRMFAALAGFLLLTLAVTLFRRKRWAWRLTIILLVISMVTHLLKGWDYEESTLALILLIQLIWLKPLFTARSDRASINQGLVVLGISLAFTLAYGTIGFYVLDGRFRVNGQPTNFGWISAIGQTLAVFLTVDNAGLEPIGRYAVRFIHSLYAIGALTMAYSLGMLLRPVLLRHHPASRQERQQARQIIDAHGQTSLARLGLLDDKAYFFSRSGQSVIAYVPKSRAALALGDPIGPMAERDQVIEEFQAFCRLNDWFPVFYETLPQDLPRYSQHGFQMIQIGEDAVVDLTQFSLKGKVNQNLRTAVNRLTKTGHRFAMFDAPIADDLIQQLKSVSDEWLKHKQGSEKQFSIAWFDREHLRHYPIGVVYDAHGKITAFVNLLTGYGPEPTVKSEVTVDLMRHRGDVENGTMEFLFVSLIQHFQTQNYTKFSFSLSPLAGVGASPSSGNLEKGLNYFFEHLNQFYNFKGLHQFKEKFQPQWEPRYLVYPHKALLPEIAVALARADSGDRLLGYLKQNSVGSAHPT
jgi:phosphatidylglycerol lysyltransferase